MHKKITLSILSLALAFGLQAQATLTFGVHGKLRAESLNFKQIGDVTPTPAGENQVWDFSSVTIVKDTFPITFSADSRVQHNAENSISITEGGDKTFFFSSSAKQKLYYGTNAANATIRFTTPMVDLRFPFKYGDAVTGAMDGSYSSVNETSKITGVYTNTADATGTLILPNGDRVENVLRVKYKREYDQEYLGTPYHFSVTMYKFYITEYAYPIVSLQYVKTDCDCACKSEYQKNYINYSFEKSKKEDDCNKSLKRLEYSIYPNPVENDMSINFKVKEAGKIRMDLMDLNGQILELVTDKNYEEGEYTIKTNINRFATPNIFLRIEDKNGSYSEKIIRRYGNRKK